MMFGKFRLALGAAFAAVALTTSAQAQGNDAESMTARHFEAVRGNAPEFRLLMEAMPKGADLHSHLTGAVYAESIIRWAAEDGFCIDAAHYLSSPPCDEAAGKRPIAEAIKKVQTYRDIVDAFSVRNHERREISGHNQFFTTFFRFGSYLPRRLGDMLAEVARRAARQNVQYLELMESPQMITAALLGQKLGPSDDLPALYRRPLEEGLQPIVENAKRDYAAAIARKNELLGCAADRAADGCGIEIRWLAQVIRTFPPEMVFAQIALAFELARSDASVVGINLVAPEDDPITLATYSQQMRMIGALKQLHPQVNVSLHAGELAIGLVPPEDLRFHIREAIEIAGAKRIGHGIAIAHEVGAGELLRRMAREGIMVEINLTSNDVILGVKNEAHPFALYRKHGVPLALSTDDEGVSRIDLTHEYLRAANTYRLGYRDLKQMSRNSLTYSFLAGESLWADARKAQAKAACRGQPLGVGSSLKACSNLLAASDKARLQWQLEAKFAKFEADLAESLIKAPR